MKEQAQQEQQTQAQQESQTSTEQAQQDSQEANSNQETTTSLPAWAEGVSDEYRGIVEAKGWEDINDVMRSYHNMEQFSGKMGAGKAVVIPDPEDKEGWDKVYQKMGRPEAANGYEYEVSLEGLDEIGKSAVKEQLDTFSNIAFEAGLSKSQAKAVQQKWDAYVEEQQATYEKESMRAAHENLENLKNQWGQVYDQNVKFAQLAADKYGLGADILTAVEWASGTDKLMNMLAEIGASMAEDGYVQGSTGPVKGTSPQQAQKELDALKADPDYADPYSNPNRHKMIRQQARDLYNAIYPE